MRHAQIESGANWTLVCIIIGLDNCMRTVRGSYHVDRVQFAFRYY